MVSENDAVTYFENPKSPLPLNYIAKGILGHKTIIAAINPRSTEEVIRGILKAAKKEKSVVIFELALSEMSLSGGYTGYTPQKFADRCKTAAEKEKWFAYSLHADHLTLKKGTDEEMENLKKEIDARIDAGFTGYAIDTSFLFNREEQNVEGQLKDILSKGLTLFDFLNKRMGESPYGLEGEVGEIGITEFTTVEEAVHYVKTLEENGVTIDYLAIANGSTHGVSVDAEGNVVPQLGINVKRTVEITDEFRKLGFNTRIAQHGITGTPVEVIASTFPHGNIAKGNIGTFWQRLVQKILEDYEPELYAKMRSWVLENYGKEDIDEHKTFAKHSKFAWKEFFDEVENISDEAKEAIISQAEKDMHAFINALKMKDSALICFNYIFKNNLSETY
ncbi:MAG: class II fructose-bisphosphate aldolase [Candidatus Heimdallarchaeota archaeon]|nr:class II fructose-bisphosphate aldolase [Candidatus Heimdallarchaeota archaeon]MCK4770164.1 class II fructose-bisphosphate aldolase [Candidatus Heimdallarchaeota archaeon]